MLHNVSMGWLQHNVCALPSSYLGLPLGACFKDVVFWDGMEERLWKRLLIWKRQ